MGGAVFRRGTIGVWVPPVGLGRTLGRVARPAEHGAVADVERRTASGERHHVIDGEVGGGMGIALVARAPVPVLATPRAEHPGAEPLPGPRAVQGVVAAAVRRPSVHGAAATGSARQDGADRAELHGSRRFRAVSDLTLVTLDWRPVDITMSVICGGCGVYSPWVLRLRGQGVSRQCLSQIADQVVGAVPRGLRWGSVRPANPAARTAQPD